MRSSGRLPRELITLSELTGQDKFKALSLIPFSSRIPLQGKVKGYKALHWTRRKLAAALRFLPGSWNLLGLPSKRVRSAKEWVTDRRSHLDWIQKSKGPYYQKLFDTVAVSRRPPKTLAGEPLHRAFKLERFHIHNEAYVARIPRGRLLGPQGTVITTPEGAIVEDSAWCAGWLEHDRALAAVRLPRPQYRAGNYFSVATAFAEGYAHWMLDTLPRFYGLDRVPSDDMQIVVSQPLNSGQRDSLEMLGIDLSRVEVLGDGYLEAEWLYFPSYVGEPGNPHPQGCLWLRDRLLESVPPAAKKRRIYITRRSAVKRRVVNEAELENILAQHGFDIVASEELCFREEVHLFSQAEAIVSSHGAGLTNALFAPTGCKLLEFFDPNDVKANNYALADVLGHDYWYFVAESTTSDRLRHQGTGHDDIRVPTDKFANALSSMLKSS